MTQPDQPTSSQYISTSGESDYSDPHGDDFEALSRDRIPVRSMNSDDLPHVVRIDQEITGRNRKDYLAHKADEALKESGIRISIVAEQDDRPVGFIMARLDFGEFGHTEPEAVIDTIGVDPAYAHHDIGRALLSQLISNLAALNVEQIRTELDWNNFALLAFLEHCGFRPSQRLALSRMVD
jgi:ribosomal protein S18 acetylase RimI-like enzyme